MPHLRSHSRSRSRSRSPRARRAAGSPRSWRAGLSTGPNLAHRRSCRQHMTINPASLALSPRTRGRRYATKPASLQRALSPRPARRHSQVPVGTPSWIRLTHLSPHRRYHRLSPQKKLRRSPKKRSTRYCSPGTVQRSQKARGSLTNKSGTKSYQLFQSPCMKGGSPGFTPLYFTATPKKGKHAGQTVRRGITSYLRHGWSQHA